MYFVQGNDEEMSQAVSTVGSHGGLRELVVEQLREEIITGALGPGTPIRTEAVMKRFGVSNSPLREAFAQLSSEGLIDIHRNRGAVVSQLSRDDAADLIRTIELLMSTSFSWAIPRLSGADVAPVRQAARDFDVAYANGAHADAQVHAGRFVRLILERSGSVELERLVRSLDPKVRRVRFLVHGADDVETSRVLIHEVLEAATDNDPDRAAAAVRSYWAYMSSCLDAVPEAVMP